MAEDNEELKLATPFGPILAKGSAVFIVLALVGLMYLTIYSHEHRSAEHRTLQAAMEYQSCLSRLTIYQYNKPKGEALDFLQLPPDLWACIPQFLIKQGGK